MKYQPEIELRVLWIVKELGLANIEEVEQRYQSLFKDEVKDCNLIVRRWKARKAFVIEDGRYKIANVPPWFKSLRMDQLIHIGKTESAQMLKDLEELFLGGEPAGGKKPQWRDFMRLQFTFEALDPILGGRPDPDPETMEGNGRTVFPREGDKLVVPMNWFKGFLRDNARLANVVSLEHYVAHAKGYWEDGIETTTLTAPVSAGFKGVGIAKYESVPAGKKFTMVVRWPMYGCTINSKEKIQEFFDMIAETPIKGIGANPKAYGGRIKLVNIEELA